ncbi:hypothetical protein B7463_g2714, partial [Scytalidium lignicola]
MSAWNTDSMASALPDSSQGELTTATTSAAAEVPTATKTPQEHGWIAKTAYDYDKYNQTNRELAQAHEGEAGEASQSPAEEVLTEAVGGLAPNDWASNGAKYEWDDSFGDVGPRFSELEKQLFGAENHVKTGIEFSNLTEINVTQEGTIRIQPVLRFEDAGLHPVMLENVKLAGYHMPTPVQAYCLPAIKLGHDIIACAQTGKYLAKKLAAPRPNPATFQPGITPPVKAEPLILVVCPSRELATQIFDEARRFCYRTMLRPCVIYGGGPIADQVFQLQKGCDVLIATPGRLIDFIGRPHMLTLKRLKYMIIDEADEMLHSDWETELKQIMEGGDQEEGNITYMMFSATFPKQARQLAKEHLAHDLVRIRVGRAGSSHINIKQNVYYVEQSEKKKALYDLLLSTPPARTMIFVNSKRTADEVDDFLFNNDLPCTSIHSDRTQREREDSIRAFRGGKSPILIATGVSARGLDIANVMHIINFDLPSPQYGGIDEYIHRIGRTGRIGNVGVASSFYNERDSDLAEVLVKTLLETKQAIPDFLEQYIPEGFTADGQGKTEELKFDDESDDEELEDANNGANSGEGAAWGNEGNATDTIPTAAPSGEDASGAVAPATTAATNDAWGGAW